MHYSDVVRCLGISFVGIGVSVLYPSEGTPLCDCVCVRVRVLVCVTVCEGVWLCVWCVYEGTCANGCVCVCVCERIDPHGQQVGGYRRW